MRRVTVAFLAIPLADQPDSIIIMVEQKSMFPPLPQLDNGQKIVRLITYKEKQMGTDLLEDGTFIHWVRYI